MLALVALLGIAFGVAAGKSIWEQADGAPLPFCGTCGRVLATWNVVRQHHEASHPDFGSCVYDKYGKKLEE
jgi:hypothetical protein